MRSLSPGLASDSVLDGHQEADERLHHAHAQYRDVRPGPPEAPSQGSDDGPGDDKNKEEAKNVVGIVHSTPTGGVSRVEVTQQAKGEEYESDPHAEPTRGTVGRSRCNHGASS